jgi:hypothetical protein
VFPKPLWSRQWKPRIVPPSCSAYHYTCGIIWNTYICKHKSYNEHQGSHGAKGASVFSKTRKEPNGN